MPYCLPSTVRLWTLALLLFTTVVSHPSSAQPKGGAPAASTASAEPDRVAQVEQLYAQGAALYRARKYRAAIAKFSEAYQIYPEPNLLFNMARAYEAVGELSQAMEHYRRFLENPEADSDNKVKANERYNVLRRAQEMEARTKDNTPAAASSGTQLGVQKHAARDTGPGFFTVSKWVAGGLFVAAAATGATMLFLGAQDHKKIEDAMSQSGPGSGQMTRQEAVELKDSGDTKKLTGYILLGVGGAALATSITFFLLDSSRANTPFTRTASLGAFPAPGGGALLFSGTF